MYRAVIVCSGWSEWGHGSNVGDPLSYAVAERRRRTRLRAQGREPRQQAAVVAVATTALRRTFIPVPFTAKRDEIQSVSCPATK